MAIQKKKRRHFIYPQKKFPGAAPVPTVMTRLHPFFPISRRIAKSKRSELFTKVVIENPWGTLEVTGQEPLDVYDYRIIIATLALADYRVGRILDTTLYQICKTMDITPCSTAYQEIRSRLHKLTYTILDFHSPDYWASGSMILADFNSRTGRVKIAHNFAFKKMFALQLITNIIPKRLSAVKGDEAKIFYSFLQGQKIFYQGSCYAIHIVKLCRVLNIETDNKPLWYLRAKVKAMMNSLKDAGEIMERSYIADNDVVRIWKKKPINPYKIDYKAQAKKHPKKLL